MTQRKKKYQTKKDLCETCGSSGNLTHVWTFFRLDTSCPTLFLCKEWCRLRRVVRAGLVDASPVRFTKSYIWQEETHLSINNSTREKTNPPAVSRPVRSMYPAKNVGVGDVSHGMPRTPRWQCPRFAYGRFLSVRMPNPKFYVVENL